MTNEERNTALYQKMFAEQETYRKWLLEQPPEEILKHTYEYTVREDVLMSLEAHDLTDFMAQISPDFLARSNSKDTEKLMAMLPFKSMSFSGLNDWKGHFVLISKEEDRSQPLRKTRSSVRKNLKKAPEKPAPGAAKKRKPEREVR